MEWAVDSSFKGNDRFTIRRRLGAGGMGVVYEAHDALAGEVVALKTLIRADAAELYRLKNEFRSLADIAHPNLVSLFELFIEVDACFFTMELVDGEDFVSYTTGRSYLQKIESTEAREVLALTQSHAERPEKLGHSSGTSNVHSSSPSRPRVDSPVKSARTWPALRQLAEGLCALHEGGKLHRDIKPSNILVTATGRVVILDFGLTTELSPVDIHITQGLFGTPAYMAPEQVAGIALSPASDWYGVGVTIYEVLTGQLPFQGSYREIITQKQNLNPVRPSERANAVPRDLEELCLALLRREPGARPSGSEILRVVRGKDNSTPGFSVGRKSLSFVGREEYLEKLQDAFHAAKEGNTIKVYVHGGSGIGKTTLVRNFLRKLRSETQVVVLSGRCYERESIPYKALDGVVDSLAQYLVSLPNSRTEALLPRGIGAIAKMFPVLARVEAIANSRTSLDDAPDPLTLRRRGLAALQELLARISDRVPLVIFIDDLHWSDSDSITLLEHLLRPPEAPGLLMVATLRSEEARTVPFLKSLLDEAGTTSWLAMRLENLSIDDATRLTRMLVGSEKPVRSEFIDTVVRETCGNPFLIEQLVRWSTSVNVAEANGLGVSEMLDANIRELPEGARVVLETLSVAAHPVPAEVAFRASGLKENPRPLVALLRSTYFLRTSDTSQLLELYHDRIREYVVSLLSPARTQLIHQNLAASMVAAGFDDPEVLFDHYLGAAQFELASRYAVRAAGKASAALAFDRAAGFYRSALDLADEGSDVLHLKTELAQALANAGRPHEAAKVFLEAAHKVGPAKALDLKRRAAEQLLLGGHVDEGLRVIREVLHAVGLRLPTGTKASLFSLIFRRFLLRIRGLGFTERQVNEISPKALLHIDVCWAVAVGLAMVDNIRGADFQTRHLLLALRAGEPYRIARAMAVEAGFSATSGASGRQRSERFSRIAGEISARVGNPHANGITKLTAGISKFLVGEWRQALELCEMAQEILRDECTGVLWELTSAHNFILGSLLYLGELREANRRLPTMLTTASERGNLYSSTEIKTRLNFMWLVSDDPERARRELFEALSLWSHEGFHRQHYNALLAETQIELYKGNASAAWHCVTSRWPDLRRAMLFRIQVLRIEAFALRARCALTIAQRDSNERRQFLKEAERLALAIEREQMVWADPLAWLLQAGVATIEGRPGEAEVLLGRALDRFGQAGMALHRSVAQRRLGEIRRETEGGTFLTESSQWMAENAVKNPERMLLVIAPGWPTSIASSDRNHEA